MIFINKITIGIPNALIYNKYHILWHTFFKELDIHLITGQINPEHLAKSSTYLEPDTCQELSNYIASIISLQDKCDYILIPNLKSLQKGETTCPILANLSDIVALIFPNIKQLTYEINLDKKKDELTAFISLGQQLKKTYYQSLKAYRAAKTHEEQHYHTLHHHTKEQLSTANLTLLAVGLSTTNSQFLHQLLPTEITLITNEYLDYRYNNIQNLKLSNYLTDTYSKEILKSIETNLHKIDGLILIKKPNCHQLSLLYELIKQKLITVPILEIYPNETPSKEVLTNYINIVKERNSVHETKA